MSEHLVVDLRSKSYAFFIGNEQQGNWIAYHDDEEPKRVAEEYGIDMTYQKQKARKR